jgi:Clostripain family
MTQTYRRWTLMVYMAGDNGKVFEKSNGEKVKLMFPMETQGWKDIKKMEKVGSTEEVGILVQFDTLSNRDNTYRLYIRSASQEEEIHNISQQNTRTFSLPLCPSDVYSKIENIPEQNMGDPASLRDFIVWGIENYPAQNYALILWNHGTGWKEDDIYAFARNRGVQIQASRDEVRSLTRSTRRLSRAFFLSSITEVLQLQDDESRAIAFDDSSMDFLDNAKIQQAFREAEEHTGQKVSLIGMDACLMSMIEVAYQLRANGNYMVGSQELEPMDGWPYTQILQSLTTQPEMTPLELAKLVVQEYGRYYEEQNNDLRGSGSEITQSATNLAVIEKLAEAVGRLATLLRQLLAENDIYAEIAIARALRQAVHFDDEDFVDLYDFVKHLRDGYTGNSTELTMVLDELINFIKLEYEPQLILANVAFGRRVSCAMGLSIYLPLRGCSQFYDRSDFAKSGWGEFIRFHNKVS